MSDCIAKTFDLLLKTDNEAAVYVLTAALESRHAELRNLAIDTILSRRNSNGHRTLLRRLHLFPEDSRKRIKRQRGHITQALRDILFDTDEQACTNGCQAILWFREYDLIPALINALTDQANPNVDIVGQTLLDLVESLYEELASPGKLRSRRDPQIIRQHTITALESAVRQYSRHRRREAVESFLILANRDDVLLKQVLSDPHHAAFVVMIETLSHSSREAVIQLLLALLDDPHSPSAALSVIGNRHDLRFLEFLLHKIGREPSKPVQRNLKRIASIGWLKEPAAVADALDGAAQHSLVKLVAASGVPRRLAFDTIAYVLEHGQPAGRPAAAEVLAEFNGAQANDLALGCLNDDSPQVQAKAIPQLRSRGIPGTLSRLVELLDSPHAVVRQAARKSLEEFSFQRYLAAFEMLDEEVRRGTGMLVKKVDPRLVPLLAEEMKSPMRTRRLRALEVAKTVEAVEELEANIIAMLNDEDHLVRVEAATTLAQASSQDSSIALRRSLEDSSPAVREAARQTLKSLDNVAHPHVAEEEVRS